MVGVVQEKIEVWEPQERVADRDLEGGGGGGPVLIYLPCRPFSLQSFLLFFTQNKGGGARPPGPLPRSATENTTLGILADIFHYINAIIKLPAKKNKLKRKK